MMKKETEDIITYTLNAPILTSFSHEEIVEKFGKLFFCTDDEYNSWCRLYMGDNEGIHKTIEK